MRPPLRNMTSAFNANPNARTRNDHSFRFGRIPQTSMAAVSARATFLSVKAEGSGYHWDSGQLDYKRPKNPPAPTEIRHPTA